MNVENMNGSYLEITQGYMDTRRKDLLEEELLETG
jgi:hypothetical protein